MTEADRFAIGSGRARPPHQPHELACPQCGAPIALQDEQGQVVVCAHCRSQIELSLEQARAIGAVGDAPPGFQLEVGAPFQWLGVSYQVVGRVARCTVGEPASLTYNYLLYNPTQPALSLACYDDVWTLSRRTRVMPTTNVSGLHSGAAMTTHDGMSWRCVEAESSEIVYVDGALPWLAKVGDQARHVEFEGDGGRVYEAERNPSGELEYGTGRTLTAAEIAQATGGVVRVHNRTRSTAQAASGKDRLRAISIICMLFGLVSLITGMVLAFSSTRLASEQLPATGGEVGPIEIHDANTVLDIEIRQRFRQDGWSFVEGEVLDEDENHLFGFGDELWAESGYDGGSWHEENNSYDLLVTIPEPGKYYLGFTAQVGLQNGRAAEPKEVGRDMQVTVERKPASTVPFWWGAVIGLLLGLLLFEIATGVGRRAITNMETS